MDLYSALRLDALVTLVQTKHDCLKKLFTTVGTTRQIS